MIGIYTCLSEPRCYAARLAHFRSAPLTKECLQVYERLLICKETSVKRLRWTRFCGSLCSSSGRAACSGVVGRSILPHAGVHRQYLYWSRIRCCHNALLQRARQACWKVWYQHLSFISIGGWINICGPAVYTTPPPWPFDSTTSWSRLRVISPVVKRFRAPGKASPCAACCLAVGDYHGCLLALMAFIDKMYVSVGVRFFECRPMTLRDPVFCLAVAMPPCVWGEMLWTPRTQEIFLGYYKPYRRLLLQVCMCCISHYTDYPPYARYSKKMFCEGTASNALYKSIR